jgi:hypothetical protein
LTAAGWLSGPALAQSDVSAEDARLAADEKKACERNLTIIYDAIQAYRMDHKDVPNWLSDLVPQYISDPNLLVCPVCKRTGETESGALADPKISCSYLYEFCPVTLTTNEVASDLPKTRREWKRKQMSLVGSMVPIVRCRHHGMVLNLAFDGRIYESTASWEDSLTNQIDISELTPSKVFASELAARTPQRPKIEFPPRDPEATPSEINLNAYYNASLNESLHGTQKKNDLASLPSGLQELEGVEYDVRGIIQLASKRLTTKRFPAKVNGIKIQQKCKQLHFLQATAYGTKDNDGDQIGSYVVHYATNQMQLEIPVIYGRDVCNWNGTIDEQFTNGATVAWTGTNEVSAAQHRVIRLFTSTWTNIAPEVPIKSIDFVSAMRMEAPFLIAITAE